jgi:hypothetical protein
MINTFTADVTGVHNYSIGADMALSMSEIEFEASVVQFMRPDGVEKPQVCNLPTEVLPAYLEMRDHDCRFEAEELQDGMVSVTISSGEEDIDISLTANGPDVREGMIAMLERHKWRPKEGI